MHQERGASAAGALNIQDRMAAAGLPAPWPHTVHERRDDEEVTAGGEQNSQGILAMHKAPGESSSRSAACCSTVRAPFAR